MCDPWGRCTLDPHHHWPCDLMFLCMCGMTHMQKVVMPYRALHMCATPVAHAWHHAGTSGGAACGHAKCKEGLCHESIFLSKFKMDVQDMA